MSDAERVPSVDVVVLTWNDAARMRAAVRSAVGSTGVDVRVTVVDNGSDPPASVPGVDLARSVSNRGVAAGRNLGVRRGTGEYVCILDSDATLDPSALREMVAVLERDPTVALVAPVFVGQPPDAGAGRAPSVGRKLARALGLTTGYRRTPGMGVGDDWTVEFAIGACQVFRRCAFDRVGGLDESDPFGPEDVDFCLRLRDAGWGIRQSARARCVHPPRRAHRSVLEARGWRHALAVARFYWRRLVLRSRSRSMSARGSGGSG